MAWMRRAESRRQPFPFLQGRDHGDGRVGLAAGAGAAAGAALMYALDPERGRRRRALVRDKAVHSVHETARAAGATARDARNRSVGLVATARKRFRGEARSAAALAERVRAEIGVVCTHPGAIEVEARDRTVTLRGPILEHEVEGVRSTVQHVPGVETLNDHLEVHKRPDNVPSLQGRGNIPPDARPEFLQQRWAPAPRALAGTAGAAAVGYGLVRRGVAGATAATVGGLVLARAATNLPMRRLTGIGSTRRAIDLQKTIEIDAPLEEVWAFWDNYENFPTFMSHVRDVRVGANGRSHWKVEGPLGTTLEWDADVTKRIPHHVLAWKSAAGAVVQHAGIVRFEPSDGGTRVHVRLSYNPGVGAAGHAAATLLGVHPKKQLDDDLLRMKTMIETGVQPHDAARSQ